MTPDAPRNNEEGRNIFVVDVAMVSRILALLVNASAAFPMRSHNASSPSLASLRPGTSSNPIDA